MVAPVRCRPPSGRGVSGPLLSSPFLSGVAQLAEHLTVNQRVVGSSPTPGARLANGAVAQWSERGTHNPLVVGSIPTRPTTCFPSVIVFGGSEVNPVFAETWSDTWNSHDPDAIVRLYADEGVHRMAAGATYVGAASLREMVDRSLRGYPDIHFAIRDHQVVSVSDNLSARFVIEYTMTGTQLEAIGDRAGTGKAITIDGAMIGELDASHRIRRCTDYLDHHSIRQQLGLID